MTRCQSPDGSSPWEGEERTVLHTIQKGRGVMHAAWPAEFKQGTVTGQILPLHLQLVGEGSRHRYLSWDKQNARWYLDSRNNTSCDFI